MSEEKEKGGLWVLSDGIDPRSNHISKIERLAAQGKIPLAAGLVGHLHIYHDNSCGIWTDSKLCDCDPDIKYEAPDDVKAAVVLDADPPADYFEAAQAWVVERCPYCRGRHVHGAGWIDDDPREFLGRRVAHCGPWGYDLVEAVE